MSIRTAWAVGAAAWLTFGLGSAQAAQPVRHHVHRLPPVSGTIRLAPQDFGSAQPSLPRVSRFPNGPVEIIRGGPYPRRSYAYQAISPAERWATGGTGVSGLIGNTGNPFAGQATWGTADSATTGTQLAPRYSNLPRRGLFTSDAVERPLTETYGERPIRISASYDYPVYGSAPQVPFYSSGAPSSMAYYGSSSSAGPYGSPGGLGVYRSGSYGYGPRIIAVGGRRLAWGERGCACGPRIIHLHRHHRGYAAR